MSPWPFTAHPIVAQERKEYPTGALRRCHIGGGGPTGDVVVPPEVPHRAKHFIILDRILYKKSYGRPLLRCLGPKEAGVILGEIHEGYCGSHMGSRALARKFTYETDATKSSLIINSS